MKIAQLSTPFITVPPPNYGGTELVAYNLTEGLVKQGHDVTLFATGDSKTSGELKFVFDKAVPYDEMSELFSPLAAKLYWMHSLPTMHHAILPFEQADKFDIIHNHIHYIGLYFASLVKTPTVHTYHGDFSSAVKSPIEKMILEKYKHANWIAISETQKRNCPIKLNFVGVVYHGVPIEKYEFNEYSDEYLVWLGRITPKKGIVEAIQVAQKTKKHLIIAGVIHPRDQEFFDKEVNPHIDEKQIHFVGGLDIHKKTHLFKKAKILLYPVKWEEPFGLVMIEAMACGTPVVAYANGAVTEIIKDGETGFLINQNDGVNAMVNAVNKIYAMPEDKYIQLRHQSRLRVEQNFTIKKMVEAYEKIYKQVIKEKTLDK